MKKMFNLCFVKTVVLVAMAAFALNQSAQAANVTWNGADIVTNNNYNWSDANNWSGGTPSGNIVIFPSAPFPASTNAAGLTNNIVDQNMTVAGLIYNDTNSATWPFYDTTFINPGVTLMSTGSIPLVVDGFAGGTQLNTTANMVGTNYFFIVTNYEGTVWIGGTNAANVESATFTLGDGTNIFDIGTFNLGNSDGGNGRTSTLGLGNGPTTISANTLNLGLSKAMGIIQFNGPGGSLAIYGTNGPTSRVAIMTMGSGTSGTGGSIGQLAITNGQPLSLLVSNLVIGVLGKDTGTNAHGILSFNNGTVDVTTLQMAFIPPGGSVGGLEGNFLNVGGSAVTTAKLTVNSPSGPGGGSFFLGDCQTNTGANAYATFVISSNGIADAYCSIVKYQAGFNFVTNTIGTNGTLNLENDGDTLGTTSAPIDSINIDGTLGLSVDGSASSPVVSGTTITATNGVIDIVSVANDAVLKTIPLISYNAANGDPFGGLTLGTFPAGYTGSLSDDGAGMISLNIQPVGFHLVQLLWSGTPGGTWDIGNTADWVDLSGGGSSVYTNPDEVAFDDTASTPNVTLNTNVAPGEFLFTNNTLNYVISGTGSISGSSLDLNKNGTASLTLGESGGDNFGGGITINGGTVVLDDLNNTISGGLSIASGAVAQIGNNDSKGNLPLGRINDNGTLVFDHANGTTDTVAFAIGGNGNVTLNGGGTVALTQPNTYTGNTFASAGTLALTGSSSILDTAAFAITNATLDVSGEAAPSLPVVLPNAPAFNNAAMTVSLTNQSPCLVSHVMTLNGTITINVTALPPIASYPTTLAVAQTQFGISGTFTLAPANLPANFHGTVSESSDTLEILLTLTSGPTGVRPTTVWNATNGISANVNWSSAINWELPGAPTPADNVYFVDNGTAVGGGLFNLGDGPGGITSPANANNIMDTSFTVGSLTYTNVEFYQNTLMASGTVLNVVSNGSLTIGSGTTDFGNGDQTLVTIAGSNCVLNVNNTNGTIFIGEGDSSGTSQQATLDLSGLGIFNANASRLLVGVGSSSEGISLARESGLLYLAQTNNITTAIAVSGAETSDTAANAIAFDIGDDDGNAGATTALFLGQTNAIFADAIGVGRQKATATLEFNPNFTGNNTAYFRGVSTNFVGTWSIGDGVVNSGGTANGLCDFTTANSGGEGYVNALVGTLIVGQSANSTSATGTNTAVLSFDNGVIDAQTVFIGNQPAASKGFGIGTVNVNTNNTLGVSATLAVSGAINLGTTVAGGVSGIGALNIAGGTVEAGSVVCSGSSNSTIVVGYNGLGGTLSVTNTIGTRSSPLTTLTLQGGQLQLNPVNGGTNIVAGTLTISSPIIINITSVGTTIGGSLQVALISYTNTDPGIGNLSIGTIPNGFSGASLSDNGAGLISLNITAPPVLAWVGAVGTTLNSTWDIGTTPDWASGSTFANDDLVVFNDAASNATVNLTTALTPESTTVSNNVLNYAFTGSGNITGNAFVKQGTASLVIDNSGGNNFSSVNIAGGTVQLGNSDANGGLGSSAIADNGSLMFDQNVNSIFDNVISGNGNISQIGNSILTLNGANSGFTGTISATNGTIVAGSVAALGATTNNITISEGGTLDDNGQNLSTFTHIVVSGSGVNGQGAIVNSGAAQTTAFGHITLAGNTVFGGTNRWDLRLTGGSLLTGGQPYSITKVGTNQISIVEGSMDIDPALSNIVIEAGDYAFQVLGFNGLGTNGSIIVYSNATVEIDFDDNITNTAKPIVLLDGSTFACTSGGNSVNDPIVLSTNAAGGPGNITYTGSGTMTWSNVVSGPGNLIKNSTATGTLTLAANNTYTGTTTIGAGTLALAGTGSIASTPSITIATNATFNVSAVSGFTLGGSQTLGNGFTGTPVATINGSVNTGSGALALTYTSGTPSLQVTNGTLTLQSTTRVTVNNTGAQLTPGTYALITSATGASITGTLPSVTVTGNGAAGTATLAISGSTLNLVVTVAPPPQLHFTSISIKGSTLTFSATNGQDGSPFTLFESTNLLLPISQWTPVFTNSLDSNGAISLSTNNVINPGTPQEFFLIEEP